MITRRNMLAQSLAAMLVARRAPAAVTAAQVIFSENWINQHTIGQPGVWWTTASVFGGSALTGDATWGEQQVYVGTAGGYGNGSPFKFGASGLSIIASPIAKAQQPLVPPEAYDTNKDAADSGYKYGWTSGCISTQGEFDFTYGHVEIVARMYAMPGCWFCGQLWPDPYSSFPEVDVVQYSGMLRDSYPALLLSGKGEVAGGFEAAGANLASGFNRYGVTWTASGFSFFFNRAPVMVKNGRKSSPLQYSTKYSRPLSPCLNLAVGATWNQQKNPDSFIGPPTPGATYQADIASVTIWNKQPF